MICRTKHSRPTRRQARKTQRRKIKTHMRTFLIQLNNQWMRNSSDPDSEWSQTAIRLKRKTRMRLRESLRVRMGTIKSGHLRPDWKPGWMVVMRTRGRLLWPLSKMAKTRPENIKRRLEAVDQCQDRTCAIPA